MALTRADRRQAAMAKNYSPSERIYARLPDGRMTLVGIPGQQMEYARARRLGIIDDNGEEAEMERNPDGTLMLVGHAPVQPYLSSVTQNPVQMDPATGLPVNHPRENYGQTAAEAQQSADASLPSLNVNPRRANEAAKQRQLPESTEDTGGQSKDGGKGSAKDKSK